MNFHSGIAQVIIGINSHNHVCNWEDLFSKHIGSIIIYIYKSPQRQSVLVDRNVFFFELLDVIRCTISISVRLRVAVQRLYKWGSCISL